MAGLVTEFPFTLPLGYPDEHGDLHREGVMRLATAADELLPLRDPRVQQSPAYHPVILLSRVVTRLGTVPMITPKVIESLFAADFNMLQGLYDRINVRGRNEIEVSCPKCAHVFEAAVESDRDI